MPDPMVDMTHEQCHECGAAAVEERVEAFEVVHGDKKATIRDRRMVCGSCGNVSYVGSQISEHEFSVAAAIRELDGLLSAEELRAVRSKYRLRQTDMEQILSTGPKTWTRWERGKVTQSKTTDKLIRLMADDPSLARRLMTEAGVVNSEADAVFEEIEREAKTIARAMLRAELAALGGAELETRVAEVLDGAYDKVVDARRQAAASREAA